MKLTKINLLNFRNCSNINVSLGDNMNIFIGNNAQGKTNILEAITMLALTKSHRVGINPNIIMFNNETSFRKFTNSISCRSYILFRILSRHIIYNF